MSDRIAFYLASTQLVICILLYPVFEAVKLSFISGRESQSAKPIFIGLENYKASISVAKFLAVDAKRLVLYDRRILTLMPLAFLLAKIIDIKHPWSEIF